LQDAAAISRPKECNIETDLQILIPDQYVSNVSERLQLYSKLDRVKDMGELRKLVNGMIDRFGPLPHEVEQLIDIVKLRWQGCQAGFEKITLKKDLLKGYIPAENNEAYFQGTQFGNILNYVQTHPNKARMKERKDQLIISIEEVKNVQAAKRILSELGSEEKAEPVLAATGSDDEDEA